MIEPRLSLLHVHRRDSSRADEAFVADLMDLPERPIHPALEYEVLVRDDDDDNNNNQNSHLQTTHDNDNIHDTSESSFYHSSDDSSPPREKHNTTRLIKLLLSFVCLLLTGTGTVVSMKQQAIPMYNYPNFLSLFCHFLYIPLCCFLYMIMVVTFSSVTSEQIIMAMPRTPFMIMGALDCWASTIQIFASIYLPGNLLVLLPQAVIPCSMALSCLLLGERYHWRQYLGAVVVLVGLLVVLEPVWTYKRAPDFYCQAMDLDSDCTLCQTEQTEVACMSHVQPMEEDPSAVQTVCQWLPYQQATKKEEGLTFVWSLLLLASAIPMTLSAMYKQVALDVAQLDPVYLNGWISIFQFLFALVVAVPAAWMTGITPLDVPRNMWDGLLCFLGKGRSFFSSSRQLGCEESQCSALTFVFLCEYTDTIDSGCHPDECSPHTPILVGSYLICAILYSTFMLCVLKYGSTSTLFMAQTILVPLGNLAFSLPLFGQSAPVYTSDLMGLVVILSGLILYRFWGEEEHSNDDQSHATWVRQLIQQVQGENPSPWYLDMVQNVRTQVQWNTPWLNDLLQHMREPLLQESLD